MKLMYVKILLLLLLLAGVIVAYSLFDPATNKFFPSCPLYKFTGLFCPGCGAQRSLHYLLTGSIQAAVSANILMVISLPFLLIYYVVEAINFLRKKSFVKIGIVNRVWFIYSVAGIIAIFWVLRNIPAYGGNILAPH